MSPLLKKFLNLNWILVLNILAIATFGIFAIYSACEFREGLDMKMKWVQQLKWMGLGLIVFFITALVDYKILRWVALPMYIVGLGCLLLVKVMGDEISGAKSWLRLGPVSFQPSQIAIVAGILLIATILAELPRRWRFFQNPFAQMSTVLLVVAVPFYLVLTEPDLGSSLVWGPVVLVMFLVGNIPFQYLMAMLILGMTILPVAYYFGLKPYQKARIETYVNMLNGAKVDTFDEAYVADKVQIAVASAGLEGKGYLGKKVENQATLNRLGFIPEKVAINDFLFAVVAEEQGFRGTIIIIGAFAMMLLQCVWVALFSRDSFGRLLVVGIVGMLHMHTFMNMGMNTLLVPITGLPLPLVSYGGTFVLTVFFLLGIVQSVWVHQNQSSADEVKA